MVRRELSSEEAASIYQDLLTLSLVLTPSGTVEAVALQIALQHNHSVYDSLYCALAIKRKCNFVTADRKLANKLSKTFPFIIHISAIQP